MIEVYSVVEGPHTPPEFDEGEFMMVVVAVVEGEMFYDFELHADGDGAFDFLYDIQKWCSSNVEPYKIDNKDRINYDG